MRLRNIFPLIILCMTFFNSHAQEKKNVVASASMIWDMVKNIGGDKINLELIVPIGGDPHLHEPTPQDARNVAEADLIFVNGLTFEGWINELIENSGTNGQTVVVTEGVDAIKSIKYSNSTDPHAWMDVRNAIVYSENIANALSSLIPAEADYFNGNLQEYKSELEELDAYVEAQIATIPEDKRVLITSHDAFEYYGKRYGLRLESMIGISTESRAQTSDIIRLGKVLQEEKIPAVFIESTINPKLIEQIAKDNKVAVGGKLYADSIGDENSPAPTYIDMIRHNTDVITKALSIKASAEIVTQDSSDENSNGNPIWIYLIIGAILIFGFGALVLKLNNK